MAIGRPKFPSDIPDVEEVIAMLKIPDNRVKIEARDYALLLVFANTPARKGEIISLNREDLIRYGDKCFLRYRLLKKDAEEWKKVPITVPVYLGIKKHLDNEKRAKPSDPMFHTLGKFGPYKKQRITDKAIDCFIKKYKAKAKIPEGKRITPHSFRAFYVTIRMKNHDPKAIMGITGHKGLDSFETYARQIDERVTNAALAHSFT